MTGPVLNRKAQDGTQDVPPDRAPDRFERRRADIVSAAIPVLNGQGFKGMRLTAVAELIGLRATGVTYYFPRKEELAVACLESGYAIFHDLIAQVENEPDLRIRIARLIELFVARDADVRRGEATPLSSFAAIRALEGEHRERVVDGYKQMFRRFRALFAPLGLPKDDLSIRALVLLEQLFWANSWLGDFDLDDFPRLARRMTEFVIDGIASEDVLADPVTFDLRATPADASKENFLIAATRQINAHGYRGASVDRISASLNLTKGAFYHHNEAKDELVAACFRRSFNIVREAQRQARAANVSEARRLVAAVNALTRFQLGPEGPLLRTSILSSMPPEQQAEILAQSYRISRQFAAMFADAIADGSGRAVDPAVAGAMLHAAVNISSDMRLLRMSRDPDIISRFTRPLFVGFLKP